MTKKQKFYFTKTLLITTLVSCSYTLFLILRKQFTEMLISPGFYFGTAVIMLLAVFFCYKLTNSKENKDVIMYAIILLLFPLIYVLGFNMIIKSKFLIFFFDILGVILLDFIIIYSWIKEAEFFTRKRIILSGFFLAFLGLAISNINKFFMDFSIIGIMLFFMFFLSMAILVNQTNLDYYFLRKSIDEKTIPKTLRRYNIIIIAIAVIFVALVLLLKPLGNLFADIFSRLWAGIISGFRKIFNFRQPGDVKEVEFNWANNKVNPEFLLRERTAAHILFYILLVGSIAFVFLVHRPKFNKLLENFKGFFKRLIQDLKKFLSRFFNVDLKENNTSSEYEDTVEYITPDKDSNTADGDIKRKKQFKTGEDPREKIRYFYKSLIMSFIEKGYVILYSDTPFDVHDKVSSKNADTSQNLSDFIEKYEQVRYGDKDINSVEYEKAEAEYKTCLSKTDKA